MTGHAVPVQASDVFENKGAFFLSMAGNAGFLTAHAMAKLFAALAAMGIVTGRTLHGSMAQFMGKGFAENTPLICMTGNT